MVSVLDVAGYFLTLSDPEEGDTISNLKLQKLLYYAQGYHLAIYDEPLFSEPIYAWMHGPVVEEVYLEYKSNGGRGIDIPEDFDFPSIPPEQQEFLNEIYNEFGQYSAWRLRNMTHAEPTWIRANERNEEITKTALKAYFGTLIVDDD